MVQVRANPADVTDRVIGVTGVIRQRGAASISMGRTPHEVRDELCPRPHRRGR